MPQFGSSCSSQRAAEHMPVLATARFACMSEPQPKLNSLTGDRGRSLLCHNRQSTRNDRSTTRYRRRGGASATARHA